MVLPPGFAERACPGCGLAKAGGGAWPTSACGTSPSGPRGVRSWWKPLGPGSALQAPIRSGKWGGGRVPVQLL